MLNITMKKLVSQRVGVHNTRGDVSDRVVNLLLLCSFLRMFADTYLHIT